MSNARDDARPPVRFEALRIAVATAEDAGIVAAEAWEAGACGVVEEERAGAIELTIYAPSAAMLSVAPAVRCAAAAGSARLAEAGRALPQVRIEPVEPVDWSEAWKRGLTPIAISPRLEVRPSFASERPAPGALTLIVDPGQAFGTGTHLSTRLALEAIDAQYARGRGPDSVLDVGTGTGILAASALMLGAGSALAFDLDPLAAPAARACARANALGDRLQIFTGPIEAIEPAAKRRTGFGLVVANLLKRELLPLAASICAQAGRPGRLVLSGLLIGDVPEVAERFGRLGFVEVARRERADADGELWVALTLDRSAPR